MTGAIAGPGRRSRRRGAVVVLAIAAAIVAVCLILLGITGDFLVDWLWFSAIGYAGVFWTTVFAEAAVFSAVFAVTGTILWANGWFAYRLAPLPWMQRSEHADWQSTGTVTLSDVQKFLRHRLPWRFAIPGVAAVLAVLVARAEVHNWGVFLRFLYQVS